MRIARSVAVGLTVVGLVACTDSRVSLPDLSEFSNEAPPPAALGVDVRVTKTVFQVGGFSNSAAFQSELEELGAGLHWSKGGRDAVALVSISSGGESVDQNVNLSSGESTENSGIFNSVTGSVTLIDINTGQPLVGPVQVVTRVSSNTDAGNGLADFSKDRVLRKYLATKFVGDVRERLYGPGV
ncbi:MAG: hypothetical protein ACPGGK_18470 [Pikeienuella sp.]